ncbi:hypothetical protein [Leptolyngbya sp. PCC 6406]|uniref:hypothetical protein n=1 Tax=Leptolyngbya sp. PCC 6406 TaxID=1173264 RepID=UPI0002ACEF05|nr:hypothetical protein [Leptolyngbya sp. PCC 6406]
MRSIVGTLISVLMFGGGLAVLQMPRLQARTSQQTIDVDAEAAAQALTGAQLELWKSAPALGFDNLVADWTFLGFLQYFGNSEARAATDYSVTPQFFEVIVNRDPYFMGAYLFLWGTVSFYAAQPETTVRLLEQGIESLSPTFPPESYILWRYKAIDELLFLGDAQAAQRSFTTAAQWADQSSAPGAANAANVSRNTAEFLKQDPDSTEAQVNSWFQIWSNAVNEETQAVALERIRNLGFDLVFEGDRATLVPLQP